MLFNYLKTSIRNFWRHKLFSFINLIGLTVGLSCSLLILLWVKDEVNINRDFPESGQIYTVYTNMEMSSGEINTWQTTPYNLTQILEDEFPEIDEAITLSYRIHSLFQYEDHSFKEWGYYASSDIFNVFQVPFIIGDPQSALSDMNSMVISENLAAKYFGEDWQTQSDQILGKVIRTDERKDFQITGVFQDISSHSTLRFDYIMPVEEMLERWPYNKQWGNFNFNMYLKVNRDTDQETLQGKITGALEEKREQTGQKLILQPFEDMYLYSEFEQGKVSGGRIAYVKLFSLVALFILVIASINFMNLATARSATRTKEIGVRKVVGADRKSLVIQFLSESLVLTFLSLFSAILIVQLLLPVFNSLTGKEIIIEYLSLEFWAITLGIGILTGFLAGSYPAVFLSSFNIISILKGNTTRELKGVFLRKALVVFQFTMSILLISSTLVIYRQLNYIMTKNLGLEKDNVVYFALEGEARKQYETFKYELQRSPALVEVSAADQNPVSVGNSTTSVRWDEKPEDEDIIFHAIQTDFDFINTLNIEVVDGRDFSKDFSTDSATYILNETALKATGITDPIGQRFSLWGIQGRIIGIVKDFHISSMYDPIEPVVMTLRPNNVGRMYVKIEAGKTEEALKSIEGVVQKFNPSRPFEYKFLDESFEQLYKSESVIGRISNYFASIAIFISCLGLLGLAAFTAERRKKEVGIRKVLGASESQLLFLLAKDVTILVATSILIALPISYFMMQNWLDQFVYKTNLALNTFILSGVMAILIAWLTISYQILKTARINPIVSLRSE